MQGSIEHRASDSQEPSRGTDNQNPSGIGLMALLLEDLRTHDGRLIEPGFLAIAVHRFGNWRMGIKPKVLRAPLTLVYRLSFTFINWCWGIDLGYTVKLGRRVRIWHHGGMVLTARSIGNDVVIRHNTTMGISRSDRKSERPTIQDRVDIGAGACILGDVTVGHDSLIGANAVVVDTFPPRSTIGGVPARVLHRRSANCADTRSFHDEIEATDEPISVENGVVERNGGA
jgi:serine O-acetyltransferase